MQFYILSYQNMSFFIGLVKNISIGNENFKEVSFFKLNKKIKFLVLFSQKHE